MKYEIKTTKKFKKQFKKISTDNAKQALALIEKLANDEILDIKYCDHSLSGDYKNFRECHIKPDLLLIYKKENDILVLTCIYIGSHSELFE